jgi:hypothetical protein
MAGLDRESEADLVVQATCEELFKTQAFFLLSIKALSNAIELFRKAQTLAIWTLNNDSINGRNDYSLHACPFGVHSASDLSQRCPKCREALGLLLIDQDNFELSGASNEERKHGLLVAVAHHCMSNNQDVEHSLARPHPDTGRSEG